MSPAGKEKPALLRALLAIEDLEARLRESQRSAREPIAIVGLACRYPGADSADAFWQNLRAGVDAVSEIPADRWDIDAYYDPDPDAPGKMYSRRGGFVPNLDRFDARFFGIAPREAVSLDPQQRLLLEVAWEALEDAAIPPRQLAGTSTGVFVGITGSDFSSLSARMADIRLIDPYSGTGSAVCVAPGRLSYILGLHGPSLAVDTACSSSLVAVHLACQSLRSGESRTALAGGVNAILAPEGSIYFCKIRALSPDGRCKTFDGAADGYVRGEGCGVIVLKRLSDAVADNDRILAVIRGSAMNHDGPSGGLTIPSGPAQEAVIRAALANAGVQSAEVGYVEAHGTGTPLGDPIELHALGAVYPACAVGSVKTNIGHLEAGAGMAGLIKVVLSLRHRQIPPHLHFTYPNPLVSWD
ncbi:MAG TPA: polyketide synthase, partial [Candidatus Acidoferrum sp.]|nr:polyketide synthase [Candidatus Acidoferrum sp.]